MAQPDYYTNISLILSRVMDDIGVNEECVMRQRRCNLIREHNSTLSVQLIQYNSTVHIFGSQTEGTTTTGLDSDEDKLLTLRHIVVIQDRKDWVPGKINLLMIPDERFPGYCKLQVLKFNIPLPEDRLVNRLCKFDRAGRVIYSLKELRINGAERHGPALNQEGREGIMDADWVIAYPCQTWPIGFKCWSSHPEPRHWPTTEMVQYMESSGCLLVFASHCLDERKDESWRISTSHAERCLMFNLNITQIRCYVLLKMIVKTFIEPEIPNVISSYICKTLLFHCLERTSRDFWKESNLLQCVNHVLLYMLAAVKNMNCPNYFNDSSNLLLGKLNDDIQSTLLSKLRTVLNSEGRFLLKIGIDNINDRLSTYITTRGQRLSHDQNDLKRVEICAVSVIGVWGTMSFFYVEAGADPQDRSRLLHTVTQYAQEGRLQTRSAALFLPLVCSYMASLQANEHILHGQPLSQNTLQLYNLSLDSDVTSSRLKFASYLYCTGQFYRTLTVLKDIDSRITESVMSVCACYVQVGYGRVKANFGIQERQHAFPTSSHVALCVRFSQAEGQCCPLELQYEMFRSTQDERLHIEYEDDWMDLAVIDSLPYLYFLQYMTYRHLGQPIQQVQALNKLIQCACTDEFLSHRETAFNLLGQCMEYESRFDIAWLCYSLSLQERSSNNAVRWHIGKLLFTLIRGGGASMA